MSDDRIAALRRELAKAIRRRDTTRAREIRAELDRLTIDREKR